MRSIRSPTRRQSFQLASPRDILLAVASINCTNDQFAWPFNGAPIRKTAVAAALFAGTRVTAKRPNDATTDALPLRSVLIASNIFATFNPKLTRRCRTRNNSLTTVRITSLNNGLIYPPFYSARLRLSCMFATHGPNTIGRDKALFRNVRQ